MINKKKLRINIDSIANELKTRGFYLNKKKFKYLDLQRSTLQKSIIYIKNKRNINSNKTMTINQKIGNNNDQYFLHEIQKLKFENEKLKNILKKQEYKLRSINKEINNFLLDIPNLPAYGSVIGKNYLDNVEIRKFGKPKLFNFKIKSHIEIGNNIKEINFETATKITSSKFVVLTNKIANLHRALGQFMIDTHINEHGYKEVYVPYLTNQSSLFGAGQLPKFAKDLFIINNDFPYYLIPTSEVPLINIFRDKVIKKENLPIKLVSHTPCFRKEAGSYGKDTKGLIRQHQFDKVELIQIIDPARGCNALNILTKEAESILKKLKLPYRVMQLCTGEMGFSTCKTYDIEVWMPSMNKYIEVSSCSWCSDFQARRVNIKFKKNKMQKSELLHTLNGSALAVGRTLAALIENYQQKDGSITIPDVLHKYMKNNIKSV